MNRPDVITRRVSKNTSGENELISVGTDQRLILKKIKGSVTSDITGDVYLYVGSTATEVGGIVNPIAGGNHPFVSNGPDGEAFPKGASLYSNQPDTTVIKWTITYVLEDA